MATRSSAERVERREDLEALKTHLPSNQNSLEAREETRSVASLPCSAFINGEPLSSAGDQLAISFSFSFSGIMESN